MNATKFAVLLVIGVLCANVSARVVEEVSKETKLGTPISKTATKGMGAQLSVTGQTTSYSASNNYAAATKGPKGSSANASGNSYTYTGGYINAEAPSANASSTSGSSAQGGAVANANPKGAAASGYGNSGSASNVKGSTSVKKGHKGKKN